MRGGLLACLFLLAGCTGGDRHPSGRLPVRLEDLAIRVRTESRAYMQSDREGAFLTGVVGGERDGDRWSVEGVEFLDGMRLECGGASLSPSALDSALILPCETIRYYRGGITVSFSGLEDCGGTNVHGVIIRATLPRPESVTLHLSAGAGRGLPAAKGVWSRRIGGEDLLVTGGDGSTVTGDGVTVESATAARFLVCALPTGGKRSLLSQLYGRADSLLSERRVRMQNLLNAAYFRTSDDTLDTAVRWMTLALDALMVDRRDTFAVSGLPWDGAIDVRDNVQSIAGLGLAAGEYARTAAVLRSLSRYQDTLRGSASFGRLPDRILRGRPSYNGADVTPWYVREMYEQVVATGDTVLLRALFGLVRRSIDGTLKSHADTANLLVHGPRETWMKYVERGNRAAEIQVLWYFQQLIGGFVASYLGDTADERRWEDLSEKTARNFTLLFADTATHTLADHLDARGARSDELRPNGVMCLDMLPDEPMRHGVIRAAVAGLLSREGVRTLGRSDPRYVSSPGSAGWEYNGPVWSWLAGPVTYALTRYDRQDLSFPLAKSMARLALGSGMAGTLPAIIGAPVPGENASLTGMSEFIRSLYQDYLGARLDMVSRTFVLQPKLPPSLSWGQFTVYAGDSPIWVEYQKSRDNTRLYLNAPGLGGGLNVSLLWMMDNGDAWRGSFRMGGKDSVAIVLGDDDILLYRGERRGEFQGKRKLKGFSRRSEAMDLAPSL